MSAEARVRLVSRTILAVGFGIAVLIYLANAKAGNASDYELEESKKYLYDLEKIGGKANVLAGEIRIWFDGLWHGRSLAFTVAVLTVISALAYRFFATPLLAADRDSKPGNSG